MFLHCLVIFPCDFLGPGLAPGGTRVPKSLLGPVQKSVYPPFSPMAYITWHP